MAYLKTDAGDQLTTDTGDFLVTDIGTTATTTTLSASPSSPQIFGTSITLTATVAPSAATGTVSFYDGGSFIGSGTLSGGVATFTTSALSVATHSITASYNGDATYDISTSSALSYTINAASAISTTTALAGVPASPVNYGTLVTFTATVSPSAATGIVNFYDSGTTLLGTGTLSGGSTSLALVLSVGAHSLTATYAGDGTYAGSTSSALSYAINAVAPPPTLTALEGGAGKAPAGQRRTVGMRPPVVLEYDRPVLTEYAAQLRRMVEAKQLQPAKELAATIADTARAIPQPTVRPQLQAVAEIADRLQRIERLNAQTQRNLARVLEIRAKAVVQAMDDEDAEMLLLN